MPHTEQMTLADVLKDVDDLLFLVEHLNSQMVDGELKSQRAIELKLRQTRGRLADLLIQRTAPHSST